MSTEVQYNLLTRRVHCQASRGVRAGRGGAAGEEADGDVRAAGVQTWDDARNGKPEATVYARAERSRD